MRNRGQGKTEADPLRVASPRLGRALSRGETWAEVPSGEGHMAADRKEATGGKGQQLFTTARDTLLEWGHCLGQPFHQGK